MTLSSDTVSRSGMFCAIATTIGRCKSEGLVDVFQVVKALRMQKPGAVCTLVCLLCHVNYCVIKHEAIVCDTCPSSIDAGSIQDNI